MAFTHILLPTDFSEPAKWALRYALEEATCHHAKVTLLHVLPAHTSTDVYFITGRPGAQPEFEPALERRLGTHTPPQARVMLHRYVSQNVGRPNSGRASPKGP